MPDDSPKERSPGGSSSSKDWCKDATSDVQKPNRHTDFVRIVPPARPAPRASGFRCGEALPKGPDVLVSEITSTSATILWSNNQDARKAHIDVLLEKKGSSLPFAFFEASGDAASFELPEGSLPKSAGPFRAQVVLESGPADRPQLTEPGMSEPFCTPAEPPSAVVCLRLLGEPRADGFTVEWQPPADDGGNPVEVYEVHLSSSQKDEGVPAERAQVRIANGKSPILCHSTQQCFSGLAPGSDYTVEVCAVAAGVSSALATIEVSTACAAPAAPSQLRARLMPGWARTSQGCICIAGEGPASPDLDVVKLEFMSPASDGGQPVQAYTIHGEEELCEDAPDVEDATESLPKSGAILRSIQVMASSMSWCAEVSSHFPPPGSLCSCHIAVDPNRTYIFSVEASNGPRSSISPPSAPVFVPARVPQKPSAPEVSLFDGTCADLQWKGSAFGGGLPLDGFKIGVVVSSDTAGATFANQTIQREVAVPFAGVQSKDPGTQKSSGEIPCRARVDGLQPGTRYSFVLAATNALGTGCWSTLSTPLVTPPAAPAPPVSAVATVSVDAEQQVLVTVSWECCEEPGSGALAAFEVQLVPAELQHVRPASDRRLLCERIAAQNMRGGQRICWAKALAAPGYYLVEVTAENIAGQRSAAAVLTLEVRPEVFPPSIAELIPPVPSWSEESLLVLGPAASSAQRFADLDASTWLQTLLLWRDRDTPAQARGVQRLSSGTLPSSIDVLCFFRRPGSGQVFRAVLASQVTTSRLQVALPPHVPMSLRLAVNMDPTVAAHVSGGQVMSEPLVVLMSGDGERLRPTWEIWSRPATARQAPRWTSLPQELIESIEAAWLEGHPKVALQLPHALEGGMPEGSYELTFGDERQTQSLVRKLGPGGWTAKARRVVLDSEGEDQAAPSAPAEELCVVCLERKRTHAFMHADTGDGHLAVCADCAEAYRAESAVAGAHRAVRTCPICRRGFSALQRIYQ